MPQVTRPKEPSDFFSTIFVVPEGEEFPFARILNLPADSNIESIITERTFVPEKGSLTLADFTFLVKHCSDFGLQRIVVCSHSLIDTRTLSRFKWKQTFFESPSDYIKHLFDFYNLNLTPGEVKSFSGQAGIIGYSFVRKVMYDRLFGGETERKAGAPKRPEIFEFYKLLAVGSSESMTQFYYRLLDCYGGNVTNAATLTFLEKAVDYSADGSSSFQSHAYQKVLDDFVDRCSPKKLVAIAKILAESSMPAELRFVYIFQMIDKELDHFVGASKRESTDTR